jgi:hypothetical protein
MFCAWLIVPLIAVGRFLIHSPHVLEPPEPHYDLIFSAATV